MAAQTATHVEPAEAAAVVRILEQAAGFTLASPQRTRAQQVVLSLPSRVTVSDFVAATGTQPDLGDFAAAVARALVPALASPARPPKVHL